MLERTSVSGFATHPKSTTSAARARIAVDVGVPAPARMLFNALISTASTTSIIGLNHLPKDVRDKLYIKHLGSVDAAPPEEWEPMRVRFVLTITAYFQLDGGGEVAADIMLNAVGSVKPYWAVIFGSDIMSLLDMSIRRGGSIIYLYPPGSSSEGCKLVSVTEADHVLGDYEGTPCKYCSEVFLTDDERVQHLHKQHKCSDCKKTGSDEALRAHARAVGHRGKIVCPECGKTMPSLEGAKSHLYWIHAEKRITKANINELPLFRLSKLETHIEIVESAAAMAIVVEKILNAFATGLATMIGFDTEWQPNYIKGAAPNPTAIVQLALESGITYIIPVLVLGTIVPLIPLFEASHVPKYAPGVHGDLGRLAEYGSFEPRGFIDLVPLARDRGFVSASLRALVALIFGKRLGKGAQMSDWSAWPLAHKQLMYAASDAFCTLRVTQFLLTDGTIEP
ncbi:3'-5' exonuclease [Thecamonas trahens ATCC 50062]|uniref:3'-5' exonuclease n=1 Tax=Thecamonas trahens ATCC 50062 TaxID=461836 RepID=A0A0L0D116_THETB|nr:3'-5' exonuclease [Thecamonas trahens ATCC 50062]KNC45927.1 3'-5' exonuclease [Thecamonas trahens ATCC 50062]|eukprot:XP_013762910.1 3'-5' exonuclease [Thecamonas trahens ATCC 50062]